MTKKDDQKIKAVLVTVLPLFIMVKGEKKRLTKGKIIYFQT